MTTEQKSNRSALIIIAIQVAFWIAIAVYLVLPKSPRAENRNQAPAAVSSSALCDAIASRRLVAFDYDGGRRVVEPHMIAVNRRGVTVLSAWFVRGYSRSGGAGWREYHLPKVSGVEVLNERFNGPRAGFRPDGGSRYSSVICHL